MNFLHSLFRDVGDPFSPAAVLACLAFALAAPHLSPAACMYGVLAVIVICSLWALHWLWSEMT